MIEKESSTTAEGEAPTVDIHYIKPTAFREAACDGVIGGPTPNGKIWLAFYSERFPLPRIMRQTLVKQDGEASLRFDASVPATVIESRQGIIRSVEFGAYLTLETAKQLHAWLGEHIAASENEVDK